MVYYWASALVPQWGKGRGDALYKNHAFGDPETLCAVPCAISTVYYYDRSDSDSSFAASPAHIIAYAAHPLRFSYAPTTFPEYLHHDGHRARRRTAYPFYPRPHLRHVLSSTSAFGTSPTPVCFVWRFTPAVCRAGQARMGCRLRLRVSLETCVCGMF